METRQGRYSVSARVLCRIIEDEAVLLDLDSGQYYSLNCVGTRIWQLLGAGRSAAAIRDHLVREYEVSEEDAERDVTSFLADLTGKRLLASSRRPGSGD